MIIHRHRHHQFDQQWQWAEIARQYIYIYAFCHHQHPLLVLNMISIVPISLLLLLLLLLLLMMLMIGNLAHPHTQEHFHHPSYHQRWSLAGRRWCFQWEAASGSNSCCWHTTTSLEPNHWTLLVIILHGTTHQSPSKPLWFTAES